MIDSNKLATLIHPLFTMLLASSIPGICGCSGESDLVRTEEQAVVAEAETDETATGGLGGRTQESEPRPDPLYRHPMLDEKTAHLLPLWLDKEHGRGTADIAIAIEDSISGDEEGNELRTSRLVAHRRSTKPYGKLPPDAEEVRSQAENTEKLRYDTVRAIENRSEEDEVSVLIRVNIEPEEPLFVQLEDAIARGEARTEKEVREHQRFLKDMRAQRIREAALPVIAKLEALGASEISPANNFPFVATVLKKRHLSALAAQVAVASIEPPSKMESEAVTNIDVRRVSQVQQFVDRGYTGLNAVNLGRTTYAPAFAQIEPSGLDDEHPGFKMGVGTGTRIRGRYTCGGGNCAGVGGFSSLEGFHATAVAGIAIGDITRDQDPSYPSGGLSPYLLQTRSGMASQGTVYALAGIDVVVPNPLDPVTLSLNYADTYAALDKVPDLTIHTPVANMSAGDTVITNLNGTTSLDMAVNLLFESGTLLIKSAGNRGNAGTTQTNSVPGSAIGAFTVGSYGSISTTTPSNLLTATVAPHSSRGGNNGRSVISLAAPDFIQHSYTVDGSYSPDVVGGTSFAAPVVTGTALAFIDWYKSTLSNNIDDPGRLFSALLLMGDRSNGTGTSKLHNTWDAEFGAGRLHARQFDSVGLDGPFEARFATICVPHGQYEQIDIPNPNWGTGTISNDVDAFMFVAYYYDSRHGTNGTLDNIDAYLYQNGTLVRSATTLDNKERIYYAEPEGKLLVELYGRSVTNDISGCGSNAMRVNYAYYFEDSDREAAEGLNGIQLM